MDVTLVQCDRATATHKAPERVVDGTCTRARAWITDKCRRRMNGREGYISIEITQDRGEEGEIARRPRERREAPRMREELGVPVLG